MEAERQLSPAEFERFCDEVNLVPKSSTHRKLKTIGENASRLRAVLDRLPHHWTTLYDLAVLPSDQFDTVVSSGCLTPLATAKELKGTAVAKSKAPASDGDEAFASDGDEAPVSDKGEASAYDGDEAPVSDKGEASASDGDEAFASDGDKAPAGDGDKAPVSDGDNAPASDGDEATASGGDEVPAIDGDEARHQDLIIDLHDLGPERQFAVFRKVCDLQEEFKFRLTVGRELLELLVASSSRRKKKAE